MILLLETHPLEETAEATRSVDRLLIELLDLSLQAEQAHWNFTGRGSKGIHGFLDELVDECCHWQRQLRESLGIPSKDRLASLAAATPLELLPAGQLRDQDVVSFFERRFRRVAECARAGLEQVGSEASVPQDIPANIIRGLERQARALRAGLAVRQYARTSRARSSARRNPTAA
jgi:starvation-inducible DNA-binding protein